jgi:SAM-dependent methyltransferase
MPNVLLNDCTKSSAYFAGDWSLLEKYLEERGEKYDLIVTSDTLYSTQYHQRLYSFMKKLLKPNGEILVAAKTYYFGCGGGVRQFEEMVNKKNEMDISVARKFTDGQSNMREILKMKHK